MNPISLAQDLIRCDSVTHSCNSACTEVIEKSLASLGFEVSRQSYRDVHGIEKQLLSCLRKGRSTSDQGIAFFAHNDVVSVDGWRAENKCGPFDGIVDARRLWGRGACDMKGPIAAAISAIAAIDEATQTAPIYFFVTGDEECGMVGARTLVQQCPVYRKMVEANSVGIITEPTQLRVVNSHKGGCQFTVTAHGIAAHSSTSDGLNANWQLIPFLTYLRELCSRIETEPSLRNEAFNPPTLSLNIVLKNQPTAYNITVGLASCCVFLRTMPQTNWQHLVDELTQRARDMELDVSAISSLSPVHTPADFPFVQTSLEIAGQTQPDAVSYATDGCRYSDLTNLIVLGPGNIAQAHRCDEWIELEQLHRGTEIYRSLLERFAVHGQ